MKKIVSVLICLLMVFSLFSCSSNNNGADEPDSPGADEPSAGADNSQTDVTITFPAAFFDGSEFAFGDSPSAFIDEIGAQDGIKDAVANADGSVTVTMTKAKHGEMMAQFKTGLDGYIASAVAAEEFPSIKSLEYNADLTEFNAVVDKAAYQNSLDVIAFLGVYVFAEYYQTINGAAEVSVVINVIDEATNETFDTIVYPEE